MVVRTMKFIIVIPHTAYLPIISSAHTELPCSDVVLTNDGEITAQFTNQPVSCQWTLRVKRPYTVRVRFLIVDVRTSYITYRHSLFRKSSTKVYFIDKRVSNIGFRIAWYNLKETN